MGLRGITEEEQISPVITNITASQVSGTTQMSAAARGSSEPGLARQLGGVEAGPPPYPRPRPESGQRRRGSQLPGPASSPSGPWRECALQGARALAQWEHTQAQTESSGSGAVGSPRERSVHPGHQREAGVQRGQQGALSQPSH